MSIRHGVYIQEEATAVQVPKTGNSSVQVVVGTAPVNMAENPSEAVNVPILANSGTEAMAALGYSVDFKNFTLCQTMFATSNLFQVSPVVYINVLDPAKHNKELAEAEYQVNQKQAVIEKEGIILEGLTVKNSTGDIELKAGEDYSAAFDSTTGFLTITMLAGGKGAAATAIKVSGKVIDPSKVTKEDVIGAVDPSTGAETGAQVIRQVYPRLGIVPGLILAPGWSQIPEVGLALAAKAAKINGVYSAMALLDLDTAKAKKYTDTKSVKEESGYTSPFCYPLWPCDRVGEYILAKSAVAGAMIQYMASDNEDVPNQSPSNHLLGVGGQCLEDGTEVYLDQDQANTVNGYGVTTAINQNGYRLWGNYTAAILNNLQEGDVLFVDEIHRLNRQVEEVLYPAMEDFAIDIMIGKGASARSIRLDLPHFTLVGATTRAGMLTAPLRDRFGVVNRLEFYTEKELQTIIIRSAGVLDVEIDEKGALEMARRSRGTPRLANRLLKRVRDFAQVKYEGVITEEVARQALDLLDVDRLGLDHVDRNLLTTMIEKFQGGPVGLDTLAAAIGEDAGTVEDVYEPYLLKNGFLQRTPRGRVVTDLAYTHLGFDKNEE